MNTSAKVVTSNLGFPYMGAQRDLKKMVEAYWAGKMTAENLHKGSKALRCSHWQLQKSQGIVQVPVGEFSLYDRVLDTTCDVGAIPQRYHCVPLSNDCGFERYFAMARGLQRPATPDSEAVDVQAMEMKKWFDTNFHFIVPELEPSQEFKLSACPTSVVQLKEAKAEGIEHPRPVLVGPVSYLYLSKTARGYESATPTELVRTHLNKLIPVYCELLCQLAEGGAEWVQMDEPILSLDLCAEVRSSLSRAYSELTAAAPSLKILVASYFDRILDNVGWVKESKVAGLHFDLVRAPSQAESITSVLNASQVASLGLVDGRNIWVNNLAQSTATVKKVVSALGCASRVMISGSCSLLHVPFTKAAEVIICKEKPEVFSWLSFATEKLAEICAIAESVNGDHSPELSATLEKNRAAIESRRTSKFTTDVAVSERVGCITPSMLARPKPFAERIKIQNAHLGLPRFPTTTIGSFPQTKEIRQQRAKFSKGEISKEVYDAFLEKEIETVIRFQESIGLDVLVHGEPERDDMVAYFARFLDGYAFTENGWVVSYGSRCVKPPVIYGDVRRATPMTVRWSKFAQSLTQVPVKGMLTGPVTMMKWAFPRDDVSQELICQQLGLALRDEVLDLERAGLKCIQVDEPAIREGLPLRNSDWDDYLRWAVDAFRLSTAGASPATQIHTHMCYSDFNDILPAIQKMDADVLAIESSRSDLKLIRIFETQKYENQIGPGVYDIHSPRVPTVEEMEERLCQYTKFLPLENIWVNPDCGLKSRGWTEVEASLRNLVTVAIKCRKSLVSAA